MNLASDPFPSLRLRVSAVKPTAARRYLVPDEQKHPHVEAIKCAVAEAYGFTVEAIDGREKHHELAWARQVVAALTYEYVARIDKGANSVAARILGRDHGAVLYSRRVVRDRCDVYPALRAQVARLRAALLHPTFIDGDGI